MKLFVTLTAVLTLSTFSQMTHAQADDLLDTHVNLQVNLDDEGDGLFSNGWYISGSFVYGEAQDEFEDVLDEFVGGTFALGYNFEGSPLALELEVGYEEADTDIPVFSGDVESLEIMFNARLDFNLTGSLDSYLGAGIGWARQELDFGGGLDDTVSGFAWQLRAGLSHPLGNSLTVYGGVRYIGFTQSDIKDEILAAEVGLRYAF